MKIGMIADNLGAPSFGKLLGTAAAGLPGVYSRFVAIVRMSARLLKSRNIRQIWSWARATYG